MRLTVTVIGSSVSDNVQGTRPSFPASLSIAATSRTTSKIDRCDVIGTGSSELHQAMAVLRDVLAYALEIRQQLPGPRCEVATVAQGERELVDGSDLNLRNVAQLVSDAAGQCAQRSAAFRE